MHIIVGRGTCVSPNDFSSRVVCRNGAPSFRTILLLFRRCVSSRIERFPRALSAGVVVVETVARQLISSTVGVVDCVGCSQHTYYFVVASSPSFILRRTGEQVSRRVFFDERCTTPLARREWRRLPLTPPSERSKSVRVITTGRLSARLLFNKYSTQRGARRH